jgi:hypothetical protein
MKPECKLIGENGDVFNLIGVVRRTLKNYDLDEELNRFDQDLKKIQESGGTYDDVLALFMEYVDVV